MGTKDDGDRYLVCPACGLMLFEVNDRGDLATCGGCGQELVLEKLYVVSGLAGKYQVLRESKIFD